MAAPASMARFQATLRLPRDGHDDVPWGFFVLPKEASDILPRRGMVSVSGKINGYPFQATLSPDGRLSHWMRVDPHVQASAGISVGDSFWVEIRPLDSEPEPDVPGDFRQALNACADAMATWSEAGTRARLDWIHWIASAKRSATRAKRISDACAMLARGKKQVCCFDASGYYSKAFSAPEARP